MAVIFSQKVPDVPARPELIYWLICSPSGVGARESIQSLRTELGADAIEFRDIESELLGLPELPKVLERLGKSATSAADMQRLTWALPRNHLIPLWKSAATKALNDLYRSDLLPGGQVRSPRSLKILSCNLIYYCGRRNEFYSPIAPDLLREWGSPSHVLALIDDCYDAYLRLTEPDHLFHPRGRLLHLFDQLRDDERLDLSSLSLEQNTLICFTWQIEIMIQILGWRHAEILIAEQLARQMDGAKFLVWGTKQLTAALGLWLAKSDSLTVYLSHPITRPRKQYTQTRNWNSIDVVSQFNGLQKRLLNKHIVAVMPSAIDEYRIKKESVTSQSDQGVTHSSSVRQPLLEDRWPLPTDDPAQLTYSPPPGGQTPNHTDILGFKFWDFNAKQLRPATATGSLIDKADVLLRALEFQIKSQVSSRDHLFVSWLKRILVFRPLYQTGSWSRGVTAEVAHWALIVRATTGDEEARAVFMHFEVDVQDFLKAYNKARARIEMESELVNIISNKFNWPKEQSMSAIADIRSRPGFLDLGPEISSDMEKVSGQLHEAEEKAWRSWLRKKLAADAGTAGVTEEHIGVWVLSDAADLDNVIDKAAEFLRTGNVVDQPIDWQRIDSLLRKFDVYDVDEKPGKGSYCCTNCGWRVTLDDDEDRLPPCGNCGKGQNTTYRKC